MPEIGLWHLRITYGDASLNELVSFITDKTSCNIIVKEDDDDKRPHIHCNIVEFKQSKSTFIQQMKKKFPLHGNGRHSCHVKDDLSSQLRYMCKGTYFDENVKGGYPQVLFKNEEIDVDKYYKAYWEENQKIMKKISDDKKKKEIEASIDKPKSRVKSWLERTYDEITTLHPVEVLVIETFQMIYKATEAEKADYENSRKILFRSYMKCMGRAVKKVSLRIHEENFNGIINSICQNSFSEAGEKYADRMYHIIYN